MDRLPPHSIEAEQGILGCILQLPVESMDTCCDQLRGSEVFYDLRHQTIFDLLKDMHASNQPIDLITVQQKLRDKNQLDAVGGLTYLSALQDATPSAANLTYYIEIVLEDHYKRAVVQTFTEGLNEVWEAEGTAREILDKAENRILELGTEQVTEREASMVEAVQESLEFFETCMANQGRIVGVSSGYSDLDRIMKGFQPGDMVVLAGRPGTGKTSLAMNIVDHVAVVDNVPTGVFSLEMTRKQLTNRLICSRAMINHHHIGAGNITDRDFARLGDAATKISKAPMFIDDRSDLNILQIRAKTRRLVRQHGVKMVVIDYLQLIKGLKAPNREQEVAGISRGIKSLAKELGIPIIILAQLNRDIEKNPDRAPRLADLRESGTIEQDADVVGILQFRDEEAEEKIQEVRLWILKHRNGARGEVNFLFQKQFTRYVLAAHNDLKQSA